LWRVQTPPRKAEESAGRKRNPGGAGDEDDKVVRIDRGPELNHIAWQRVKLTLPIHLNEKGVEHFYDDDEKVWRQRVPLSQPPRVVDAMSRPTIDQHLG
jgi:hypothetical protein